jgi:hypothetical protein
MTVRARIALAAILAAHVALTVWLSAVVSMYVDEAFTLRTTSLSLGQAAHQALVWELQPPLYFVALDLWRHIGPSIFVARLFSVIAVAIGVYVAGLIALRYVSERHRLWVLAVVATNPLVIASAVDARVYGLVFLWSALLLWLFYEGYLAREQATRARIAFALVAAAALYTQYYTGFLLPAFAGVLVMQRRWRDFGAYLGSMALVAASIAPVVLYVKAEIASDAVNFGSALGFFSNFVLVVKMLLLDVVPLSWVGGSIEKIAYVGVGIVVAAMIWRSDKGALGHLFRDPAIIISIAVVLFATAVTLAHILILTRYTVTFLLATYVVLFALLSSMRGWGRQQVLGLAAAALIVANLLSLAVEFRFLAKSGDWARVASFIAAHESTDQRIVVFEAQDALPFAYYYKGANQVVPLPHAMRFDTYDRRDVAIHSEGEVVQSLAYRPQTASRLWLVTPDTCPKSPVDFHCEVLYDFVARHYKVLLHKEFYGTHLQLLSERS